MLIKNRLSLIDDVGEVFFDDEKIYRGINSKYIATTRKIFECGLIDELVNYKLFPETLISDQRLIGYDLVLEHRKVNPITYPFEWSPEMLRNAGLTILKVNEICKKYGYELKDAQPYNLVYDGNKCLFVDFGSIQKTKTTHNICFFAEEFLKSYYYPLYIYSKGSEYFFSTSFLKIGGLIPHTDFLLYKKTIVRILPLKFLERLIRYFFYYNKVYSVSDNKCRNKLPLLIYHLYLFAKRYRLFPFSGYRNSSLKNKLTKLNLRSKTQWGNYHSESGMLFHSGDIRLTPRMEFILELVKKYKPRSVLELAGNQGVLSRKIAELSDVKHIICSDYDYQAIDSLYLNIKNEKDCKILPVILNFMLPSFSGFFESPKDRLKSELVIALAVTHHLILTQHFKLEFIIERLFEFTEKYLIIEFMPLGLFNGKFAPPLPNWYTKYWFIAGLNKKFKILLEKKVEDNRIIFMTEKYDKL